MPSPLPSIWHGPNALGSNALPPQPPPMPPLSAEGRIPQASVFPLSLTLSITLPCASPVYYSHPLHLSLYPPLYLSPGTSPVPPLCIRSAVSPAWPS